MKFISKGLQHKYQGTDMSVFNRQGTLSYIKGFDGLRAISIIFVLCAHLGVYDSLSVTGWPFLLGETISGMAGVNVFFTISGFLITILLLNEKARTGTIGYKKFIIRRFLRLLPPLLCFYLILLLLIFTGNLDIKISAVVISFCYLYNFVLRELYYNELGHTWSLAVEEQFYVFWPWVIFYFKKKGLFVTTSLIFMMALLAVSFVPDIRVNYHSRSYLIGELLPVNRLFLPPIMIGSAFAILNFYNAAQIKKLISSLPVIVLFIVLILSAFWLPARFFNYLFVFQALGYGLLLTYITHHQDLWFTTLLEWKPLAFIGKISYGIYVWQGLFLGSNHIGLLWIQQPFQNIALTFLVAILSYYFIEKKALQLKSRFQN
jgi:peptidoglycan/LPS O-acetylase OafA/YrhL